MSQTHPDFDAAPEAERWTGPLGALFASLATAAYRAEAGQWTRRVLPRGAWVAMRIKPDDFPRKELCLGRKRGAPRDATGEAAWATECTTFLTYAKAHPAGSWLATETKRDGDSIYQFYVELLPLEVAPGQVRCAGPRCDAVVAFALSDEPLRCPTCQQAADIEQLKLNLGRRADPRPVDEREVYGGMA